MPHRAARPVASRWAICGLFVSLCLLGLASADRCRGSEIPAEVFPAAAAESQDPATDDDFAAAGGTELPEAFVSTDSSQEIELSADAEAKPIGTLRLNIKPSQGDLPPDHAAPRFARETSDLCWPSVHRPWAACSYGWVAPGSRHYSLYFEETNLERYGWHFGGLQPVVSGAMFYGTVPLLPYKMGLRHYCDCQYTLGHYRPGHCVPYQCHMLPLDGKAALIQAGAVVGGIYAVP